MNSKFKLTAKRLISGFVAAAAAVTMLPQMPAFAETGATAYSYDGYDVEYSVLNEWNNGQSVEVKVTNTGDDSILNWALKYDAEGEVDNLWNALVYDNQGEDYIIKNGGWNYEIAPGQTVNFGYTLVDDKFETPDDFELCSKRVDVTTGYETALNIIEQWNTGIKAEIVITNTSDKPLEAWTYSFDSNFTIDNLWDARILENTDTHYTIVSEMWTNPIAVGDSKVIGFTATIDEAITPEITNSVLTVVEIDSLEIDWEDATDTDGDGLPDGYEVVTLRTNPTSKDTDDNGTTDDNEDFDSDNLTNYEEYLLGTDPYKADTDGDGLTDGDEVNIYNTDPLKYDTDGDGVIDSDEILFGLNPNEPTDGDAVIKQSISEDELRVNKYNDNFKISIDVEASNNVKRFIKQGISRYTGILSDNRAIIGLPISVEYSAGTIQSGTITFRLDDKFVDSNSHFYPKLGLGIERYGVFCFDKEIKTIVPLPCEYDEDNNTIAIDAQHMGDLMIIDYESLMFDLGVKPEEIIAAYDTTMTASFMAEEFDNIEADDNTAESGYFSNEVTDFEDLSLEEIESILNSAGEDANISAYSLAPRRAAAKSSAMKQVDLVLVVDTTGSMGSQIAAVKRNLSTLISKLREDGISLYVSVVDYRDITCDGKNSTKVNNNSGKDFYNSVTDITNVISSLYPSGGGDTPETAIDGLAAAYNLSYRGSSAKFAFLITDANYKNKNNYGIKDMAEMARMLNQKNIRTSVVTYSSYYRTYENLVETTNGKLIPMTGDFCSAMYEVICSETPGANVVIANNIVSGFFKEPLVKGGACDTDGDTLSDSDEIDWDFVKKVYDDGTYELYTWKELCSKTSFLWFGTAYTDGKLNPLFKTMSDIEVIPATSNPFSADTDKDYYPDNVEVNDKSLDVLASDAMFINDEGICDADFHNGGSISTPFENKYTDGVFEKYFETHDDGNQQERARYSFTRQPYTFVEFSLTPKATSFYKFDSLKNCTYVKITYEGLFGSLEYVSKEDDGTYLLKSGKEYTIEAYSAKSYEYKFTVEQDNWVYAEYGAVCTAHEENGWFASSDYKSIYISDKALYKIINDYRTKTYDESITFDEFISKKDTGKKDEGNPFYNSCVQNVEFLDKAQTYGDAKADFFNSVIGTGASLAGVYLMLPISKELAAVVTIAGGVSAVYSIQSYLFNAHVENKRQEFIDAMYDGKFNFYIYNLSTTTKFVEYNRSEIKSFLSWNTDHYVRKIYANTVYNVEPLTVTKYQEFEEGTWRVIP